MGRVIQHTVYQLFHEDYSWPPKKKREMNWCYQHFDKDASHLAIFGPAQGKELKMFLERKDVEFLFVSEKAVNVNYKWQTTAYGDKKERNTVVVFNVLEKE